MKQYKIIIIILLFIFCLYYSINAAGLQTRFSSVLVHNLHPGKSYSLKKIVKLPLKIKSTFNKNVKLEIKILKPFKQELKEGYEIIPDISWIQTGTNSLIIRAMKESETDVIIKIPDDKKYFGRKFQVMIWSHTVGRSVGCGLKSRLLFTTVPWKIEKKEEK